MVAMGIDRLVLPEVKRESPTAALRPLAEYTWSGAKSVSVPPNPTHKKKKT
jgi:hypothetical protein